MSARSRLRTCLDWLSHKIHLVTLAGGAVLVCLLLGAGLGPFTPLELDRAEHALAQGDLGPAIRSCELHARWGLRAAWRARAAYRAAAIQAHQLDQPAAAVRELRALQREGVADPELEALVLELLAESLERRGKHAQAAERYEQLARLSPAPAPWLQNAALAWERAGRPDRALLRHAAAPLHDASFASASALAMGRIGLGFGRSDQAYAHYASALKTSQSPEQARLARLGMAMALDAMGQLEQALAELDEAAPDQDRAIGIARERLQRRAEEERTTP